MSAKGSLLLKIFRAYKTELDCNNRQRTALLRHAGAARWAYNFGLRRKIEAYKETGKSPSAVDLHREINLLKLKSKEDGGVPWMYEVSKCAPQEALRNLDTAYKNFFRRCKGKAKQKGFPKFKSRKRGIGSFSLTGSINVSTEGIALPRLGKIRLKESGYFPCTGVRVLKATVSEKAGKWFCSIQVEQEVVEEKLPEKILGVDVGIKSLAVTSDGETFLNPKALCVAESRIRFLQKVVSRKQKGSSNRSKAVRKLGKQHYRVACVRRDAIHKATSAITKQATTVVIESLNVVGMMKNHYLAEAVGDAGMAEFHRQLSYKMSWKGGQVVRADRFFASSKTCSNCGLVKETLSLSERVFVCECGFKADRDLNAAINLKSLAVSSTVTACCPGSSGLALSSPTKLLVGQEPNTVCENVING